MLLTESNTTFELPPAGVHPARCYRVIDLGTQATNWQGQERASRKILITFELLGDERMAGGQPFSISRRFTASLGEKAALRAFLEAWRGKKLTPEDLRKGFDVQKLLGVYGLLNLVEAERDGRTYANIASISPLPRSMPKPQGVNELLHFDLQAPDRLAFERLSERLQGTIMMSPEYEKAKRQPAKEDAFDDIPDDLPWQDEQQGEAA